VSENASGIEETSSGGVRRLLFIAVVAVGLVAGGIWAVRAWRFGRAHVSTDNAQIDAHIVPVLAKVGGYVESVNFEDNQRVQRGELIVVLDDSDLQVRYHEAEADLASGSKATWDSYYADTLTGDRLPVPFHDYDITDADKRAAAVASYQAVVSGAEPPESLLDPRDVLTTTTEAELGFRPRPGADAAEILHHVCQRCHNDDLDQTLTRARFNAERPDELTAEQKAAALSRIMLPSGSNLQMPPPRFATLPDEEKQTLIEFLQQ
jgi:multidrug resistance efflux pump